MSSDYQHGNFCSYVGNWKSSWHFLAKSEFSGFFFSIALTFNGTLSRSYKLSKPQLSHNSTQPQFNITLVGLDTKMTLHTTPPHHHHTNSMLAISQLLMTQFCWNLNVASWEYLEEIPFVTVTFVQAIFVPATFVLVTFLHIRNISAVTDTIWTKL